MESRQHKGMSVIVPFLNESEGIKLFCKEFDKYVGTLDFEIEVIFVDDGSTDGTASILQGYSFENIKAAKVLVLSKNYGSHAAIRAGLTKASFPICTWLGSDLQEPMELLQISYHKIFDEGFDAVYVEKKSAGVSRINRCFSLMYSKMMQKYAIKNYASGGTSTIVFNNKIKDFLNENVESNSSIMLQIMDAGYRYYNIALNYKERAAGKSKWTFSKKIKLLIDSFVAFSFMPIRVVSLTGILIFIIGIIIGIATVINKVNNPAVPIGYSTLASITALGFGVTNISLGIIAEYLWRAYDVARKRPAFIISEVMELKKH